MGIGIRIFLSRALFGTGNGDGGGRGVDVAFGHGDEALALGAEFGEFGGVGDAVGEVGGFFWIGGEMEKLFVDRFFALDG